MTSIPMRSMISGGEVKGHGDVCTSYANAQIYCTGTYTLLMYMYVCI